SAQSMSVSGKVTYADDGTPVIGAQVMVKGMRGVGTLTDVNGAYKITIPAAAPEKVIVASFLGLQPQERAISSNGQVVNFALVTNTQELESVIVTGYGSVSKKEYTGSATSVKSDRTKDVPAMSFESRLAGAVSGVQITSASGAPGALSSVRIRGMGSINAGNEPLYVIDGIPVFSGDANTLKVTSDANDNGNSVLSTLNPNDIESMTVIKDAAAASLYGSRAANGVVVITTKKGSSGKVRFNAKADVGVTDMAINYRPTLDGDARRSLLLLGMENFKTYSYPDWAQDPSVPVDNNEWIKDYATMPWNGEWTDWNKELFRTGVNQNYEVSASGGNAKTRFYASMSYTDVQGITKQAEYKRLTGRVNVNHKQGNFTFDASTLISSVNQSYNEEEFGYSSPLANAKWFVGPQDYVYNKDGSFNLTHGFGTIGGGGANPIYNNEINFNKSDVFRSFSNISAQYEFVKGFTAKQVLSYDYTQSHNVVWWDPRSNNGAGAGGVNQTVDNNFATFVSQTQLAYANVFNGHSINVLASYETEKTSDRNLYAAGLNYPSYLLPDIDNAAEKDAGGSKSTETLISWVARADYNYAGRYYVGASFRRDGTSRLSPDSRWGNFWSVSGSWRMSNENWWKNGGINTVLTEAKLRASYGVNGTRPNNWYGYLGTFGYGYNYDGNPGSSENRIPNPNLKWEQNYALNVGVDLSFIDRINLSVDFYNRDTKDLIMDKQISQTTGFATTLQNVGSMNNMGVEIDLNAIAIQRNGVEWNVGINLSHNKNTLTKLDGIQDQMVDARWLHKVGMPYYSFFLLKSAGVDPATGLEQYYVDPDKGDYSTTTDGGKAKKAIVGSWEPKVQGGITSNFKWSFIDFSFTFTYSLGGLAVDNLGATLSDGGNYTGAIPTSMDINKMWKKPGDVAELPMFTYENPNVYTSSRFLMSTDHLRLKNITIGFTTPKKWFGNSGFEGIRLYVAANNLFTIKDKNLNVDPETPVGGIVGMRTPPLRTVSLGLEIKF
ncbi:MAG: SusC/RagA family TonB-linked outer membrane protein, partial [Mucinivorans sp.]